MFRNRLHKCVTNGHDHNSTWTTNSIGLEAVEPCVIAVQYVYQLVILATPRIRVGAYHMTICNRPV